MIEKHRYEKLAQLVKQIQHPVEVQRTYQDDGLLIVLAQNVRDNRLEFAVHAYMSPTLRHILSPNKLTFGDILMTRSGANFGQSATFRQEMEAFACADILVLRSPSCPSGYLSTFFNTQYGRCLLDRGAYGMAQPHIAPPYLNALSIPRLPTLENKSDVLVERADAMLKESKRWLQQAESVLLRALDLDTWRPPEPLTYTRRAADVFAAGRMDSPFFAPRVAELLEQLSADSMTIQDVAPPRHDRFMPRSSGNFDYIEISDVLTDGTARSESVEMSDAPSRATWYVRTGDVITSTVRPVRKLSALVLPEQDRFVCSSGFVVLQPQQAPAEVLLTYLRLPIICELLDLHTSASMYPAISEADLLRIPYRRIGAEQETEIVRAVRHSHELRRQSQLLLDRAKRAVEIAIEESEVAALAYLNEQETQTVP